VPNWWNAILLLCKLQHAQNTWEFWAAEVERTWPGQMPSSTQLTLRLAACRAADAWLGSVRRFAEDLERAIARC
jgi:hypothetical protein